MGQGAEQGGEHHRKGGGEHPGDGHALPLAPLIPGAEALGKADAEAAGKALDKAEHKIDHHRGGPHRGQSVGAEGAAHDDRVRQGVEQLK